MSEDRVIAGSWVKVICRALDAAGFDSGELLRAAGIDPRGLDGPNTFCPLSMSLKVWDIAMRATGDPAFGVKAASQIKFTSFHVLSFGIAASCTLKEAFERAQRFCHVVSNVVEYEFYRRGDEYHFTIEPTAPIPNESLDCLVGAYLRMARSFMGREFSPLRVEMRRLRPPVLGDFESLIRAPITFGAAETKLVFDADSMHRGLEGDPELARHQDELANDLISRSDRENITARVRQTLTQKLVSGEPTQDEVAVLLGMSSRTLQRKLNNRGATYKDILEQTRRELAFTYLREPHQSVTEVGYRLGYSDPSCFTRAFRRWTNHSPIDWRRLQVKVVDLAADGTRRRKLLAC
jgi:AraC-like DNA-binding protein